MLVALHFCSKDRLLAEQLAEWLVEIGPFNHDLLIARDGRAAPIPAFYNAFRSATELLITDDIHNQWCASANHAFKKIAKHIQYACKGVPFLHLEPDAVVLRASAFNEIEAEYRQALSEKKVFLGDMIDHRRQLPGSVLHMSGIGVYPGNMTQYAGKIFYADDKTPWDIVAGPAIHSQAKQSELIFHVWNQNGQGLAPFKDWSDVEAKIFSRRPKCALFHSDKSGSLIQLLREHRKEGDAICGTGKLVDPPLSSAEPTSKPESSAEIPSARIAPEPPLVTELPSAATATLSPCPVSFHDQTPWENRDASLIEIRRIAARLRQFQTNRAYVRYVRQLLAEAGVIVLAKKKRRKKKKK